MKDKFKTKNWMEILSLQLIASTILFKVLSLLFILFFPHDGGYGNCPIIILPKADIDNYQPNVEEFEEL